MKFHGAMHLEATVNNTDPTYAAQPEEVAVLGVASTDTKGGALTGEEVGGRYNPGIAED